MKLLFDVSCLDHERISGVGTYARFLLAALGRRAGLSVTGSWKVSRHKKLRWIRSHCVVELEPYIPFWSDLNPKKYDVFHGPDYRIPGSKHFKRVVTIHDLAFYEPKFTADSFARKRIAVVDRTMAKYDPEAIVAVSEFTRQEIIRRFPKYAERTFTVHHGADHLLIPSTRGPRPIENPYFLFVGNLEARKNVTGLIRAFSLLKQQPAYKDFKLILVGKAGFAFDEIKDAAKASNAREDILLPGFISNMGLVNYYQSAEAFVYPSHYEGFGFPILEAMRLGCPVITASTTASAEVAGDAAILAAPDRDDEIAEAMARLALDSDLKRQLIDRGHIRGKQFSWADCAEKTEKVYQFASR